MDKIYEKYCFQTLDSWSGDTEHWAQDVRGGKLMTGSIFVFNLPAPGEGVRGPQAEHSGLTGMGIEDWETAGGLRH